MIFSKHNIISRIADSDNFFIVNPLSRQADLLTPEEFLVFKSDTPPENIELIKKGYVVDAAEEEKNFRKQYLEFIDSREEDEIQLFYVPSYACNFACSYCYQDEYNNSVNRFDPKIVDAFFNFILDHFAHRQKYLTIFGGEPLLNDSYSQAFLDYFIKLANQHRLELAIVTNGYNLVGYIPLLKQTKIREIQITLDGIGDTHNKRRPLKGGGASFEQIVQGIDKALENEMPVNLRMVIDKDNIQELPVMAKFAMEKGWTKSPLFKTQLGRNYELHHCRHNTESLYNRIGMYTDIYHMLKSNPEILDFHKPAFSIAKYLFENGELPEPLFDSCPGTKTEWAFDYSGSIYSCTATVGKKGEELGTFYPEVKLNKETIQEWEERDVLSIAECRNCNLQLACGGGCASVAKNSKGVIHAPDCRPVKQLLELGIAHYFEA